MPKIKIKDFLKTLITKNIGWKLFSCLMALILWFVVMNLLNPTEIKNYAVNLSILNESSLENNNFAVLNKDELEQTKVEIKIRGTRPALDELTKSNAGITARVDLKQIDVSSSINAPDAFSLSVSPSIPQDLPYTYEIISCSPNVATVILDNKVSEDMAVETEINGTAAEGYITMNPVISESSVTVTGLSTEVAKIKSLKLIADVTGLNSSFNQDIAPVAYDENFNILEGLKFEPETINVNIRVNKQGSIPVSEPIIKGAPLKNHKVTSVDYSPKEIRVTGSSEDLLNLPVIELPGINIAGDGVSRTVLFDVNQFLEGTNLVLENGSPSEITVTVNIEPEKIESYVIPMSQVSLSGYDDSYDFALDENVTIYIKGSDNAMSNFDPDALRGNLSLSGLNIGANEVVVSFSLPEGVVLAEECRTTVIVSSSEPSSQTSTSAPPPENNDDNVDAFAPIENESESESESETTSEPEPESASDQTEE